jgi:deoxycytidine triphosphate deaminase
MQVHLELAWSETFVLHPQEVVLGATLEYVVLPADLAGQVVTRSSYGRLGLLSATAVQIHPRFHGCLTLELVNLSTIPITLTPGERIAQLVLWRTAAVDATHEKYSCPIGPEFSRVRDDPEADVLRALRRRR